MGFYFYIRGGCKYKMVSKGAKLVKKTFYPKDLKTPQGPGNFEDLYTHPCELQVHSPLHWRVK